MRNARRHLSLPPVDRGLFRSCVDAVDARVRYDDGRELIRQPADDFPLMSTRIVRGELRDFEPQHWPLIRGQCPLAHGRIVIEVAADRRPEPQCASRQFDGHPGVPGVEQTVAVGPVLVFPCFPPRNRGQQDRQRAGRKRAFAPDLEHVRRRPVMKQPVPRSQVELGRMQVSRTGIRRAGRIDSPSRAPSSMH